jgi:hypothetical protein
MAKQIEVKGVKFSAMDRNTQWGVIGDSLVIHVDLSGKTFQSKNDKPMLGQAFINIMTETSRVFGNLNLNVGAKKSALIDQNAQLQARIKELEAKLSK